MEIEMTRALACRAFVFGMIEHDQSATLEAREALRALRIASRVAATLS